MPEILGESGLYFDPLKPESIAKALRRLADDADLRGRLAAGAYAACRPVFVGAVRSIDVSVSGVGFGRGSTADELFDVVDYEWRPIPE